jgi:hypothetical protein
MQKEAYIDAEMLLMGHSQRLSSVLDMSALTPEAEVNLLANDCVAKSPSRATYRQWFY